MGFALLIIFMFVAFGLTTLFRKWIDVPTLIAVAIGCAVNANIFNPIKYPIELDICIKDIITNGKIVIIMGINSFFINKRLVVLFDINLDEIIPTCNHLLSTN